MSFDLTGLAAYTKDNAEQLATAAVLGNKTQDLIKNFGNVMVGVSSSEHLNILDTDAVFQSDSGCGFNASGTTSVTQKTLTVGKIKVEEDLCPKAMKQYYLQLAMMAGSKPEEIFFEQKYLERKNKKIAFQNGKALWQGDTLSGDGNLNKFDGLLKLIDADGTVIAANDTAYGLTAPITTSDTIKVSNVISIFDAVYQALPASILDNPTTTIFCEPAVFRTYTVALKNANMFHYTVDKSALSDFILPGTPIKVVSLPELTGTNRIIGTHITNLWMGVDLMNEESDYEMFYAREAKTVRFSANWKLGTQFTFGNEIASFKLA